MVVSYNSKHLRVPPKENRIRYKKKSYSQSKNIDCVVNLTKKDLNPILIDFKKKIINYITDILDL